VIDMEALPSPVETDGVSPGRPNKKRRLLGVLALVAALVLAAAYGRRSAPAAGPSAQQVASTVQAAIDKANADAANAPAAATAVYQAISPSLVVIEVKGRTKAGTDDDGLGTGVVINASGQILTANHVVDGARAITLSFADGTEASATIVSSDRAKDIAVLLPDALPETVVPAVIGGGVRIGDDVFAVGHPFGLVGSLSAGVVSGLERSAKGKNGSTLNGLIQFDAAVNPGNSGGPLLNRRGQVVGIVTALANPSDQSFFVGIGFAVPIATAGGAAGGPTL
jgi:S1-C subfamily serine protease